MSDWSSDVCSSDLPPPASERRDEPRRGLRVDRIERQNEVGNHPVALAARRMEGMRIASQRHIESAHPVGVTQREVGMLRDRKRVVKGKRVTVRWGLGGGRIPKKKKKMKR